MSAPSSADGVMLRWRPSLPAWWRMPALPHARRLGVALFAMLVLLPVVHLLARTAPARGDIVYWDEFDTVLALMLKLDAGATPGEFFQHVFALSNEHRMVTSRLIFATSYWLTGTVNFSFLSLVGIGWIVGLAVLLVVAAKTSSRRALLAALLAGLLFQLEHYENFLWSGSSIDHFQVPLLAGAAIVALARGTRGGTALAALFALLATFTLAHGLLVWPVGAAMLWHTRRCVGRSLPTPPNPVRGGVGRPRPAFRILRAEIFWWCVCGAAAIGAFLIGFEVNSAQRFASVSLAGAAKVAVYWLSALGAVPALGSSAIAPWLGAALLGGLVTLAWQGAARREPVMFWLALYAAAALALIAVGRAEESNGVVFSRYYVLSALAWVAVLFMVIEARFGDAPIADPVVKRSRGRRRWLVAGLLVLTSFHVAANARFAPKAESWLECRDRAVLHYEQHGADGRGPLTLHPQPNHATALLREVEQRGLYRLGSVCQPRSFPDAKETGKLTYFVEEVTANDRAVYIEGWAALPGERSQRGELHLVLRADGKLHTYTTVAISRPDVAAATGQPGWVLSGFRFALRREQLPAGDFQIGFLLDRDGDAEYTMTAHRLQLAPANAQLATNK